MKMNDISILIFFCSGYVFSTTGCVYCPEVSGRETIVDSGNDKAFPNRWKRLLLNPLASEREILPYKHGSIHTVLLKGVE